jgi:hypothetical protein
MRVVNIHKRQLFQEINEVANLFDTLATDNDAIWPYENWPAIRFKDGLKVGSKGGHGIIRYKIIDFKKGERIIFEFTDPKGFSGTHQLFLKALSEKETEIIHEIRMQTTTLRATVLWVFVIRWLHDALIEEAFDKIENQFSEVKSVSQYNFWVNFLRNKYKKKKLLPKPV